MNPAEGTVSMGHVHVHKGRPAWDDFFKIKLPSTWLASRVGEATFMVIYQFIFLDYGYISIIGYDGQSNGRV